MPDLDGDEIELSLATLHDYAYDTSPAIDIGSVRVGAHGTYRGTPVIVTGNNFNRDTITVRKYQGEVAIKHTFSEAWEA